MRILVTNDDGIDAPGIAALARALATHHDVVVAAPDRDMSGSSAGIARFGGIKEIVFTPRELPSLGEVPAYTVAAGPGLAVLAGCLGAFGDPPDLVVSGINAGANLGHSILHSGTVGAVLTAQSFGVRGLAVSAARGERWQWETACRYAMVMTGWLAELPPRSAINLNVPALPLDEVRGLRHAKLDRFGTIRLALTEETPGPLQIELRDGAVDPKPGTDSFLLAQGFATYTALVGVGETNLDVEPPAGLAGEVERRVVAGGDA